MMRPVRTRCGVLMRGQSCGLRLTITVLGQSVCVCVGGGGGSMERGWMLAVKAVQAVDANEARP